MTKTVMVTGSSGFVGRKVCEQLSSEYKVIAFDKIISKCGIDENLIQVSGDITNDTIIKRVCVKYRPDIIVHCAGIAHQKISSSLSANVYDLVNHIATKNLSIAATSENPDVHFIFLSSISVYGENHKAQKISEEDLCLPTTSYALSKLNAEKSLIKMFEDNTLKKLDILRLAPVYSSEWSLNLEKRVFGPKKMCYLRFGSGDQKMSVLSTLNLINFIEFRLKRIDGLAFCNIFNVCDEMPCSFNQIIDVFKKSKCQPNRWTVNIPLGIVWLGTKFLGGIIRNKSTWIYSCYDKLANSLVFDNKKMLDAGFKPVHTLETIFKE